MIDDMRLAITPIGWALYVIVYLPLALAVAATARRLLTKSVSSTALQAIVLIPTAISLIGYPVFEAMYSEWQMQRACPDARGLVVYKRVIVDGYFDEHGIGAALQLVESDAQRDPDLWERVAKRQRETGYRFLEWEVPFGRGFYRQELTPDGKIRLINLEKPTARYRYMKSKQSVIGLHVVKFEQYIMDMQTGQPIASDIRVSRKPSFIDRFWLRFLGPAENVAGCAIPNTAGFSQEREHILIPIDKSKGAG
jgi:hypothetical protein